MTSHHIVPCEHASWIELSRSSFLENIHQLKSTLTQPIKFGVVLKGNAYGHGFEEVVSIIHGHIDCIYVINPYDALHIRQWEKIEKKSPVSLQVLGPVNFEEMMACAREEIELTLGDDLWKSHLEKALTQKVEKKITVHIHIDSGLCREGFLVDEMEEKLSWLYDHKDKLHVKGIMSHFANTEDVTEQEYANLQVQEFLRALPKVTQILKIDYALETHIAASAATLILPPSHFSTVRSGISLYGLWPSEQTRVSAKLIHKNPPKLKPTLEWKCDSVMIKDIKEGSYVGYGCTYRCTRDTRIAIFPVGYFDGYPRALSGKAYVLVDGHRCQVIGRIMMNSIIVDISNIDRSKEKVTAVLVGHSEKETLTIEKVADWGQTINYEIAARLGVHLQRKIVE